MKTLLWTVGLFALAVGVTLLADVAAPYRVDISMNLAILIVLATFAAGYLFLHLIISTLRLPTTVKEFQKRRRQAQARAVAREARQAFFEGRHNRAEKLSAEALALEDDGGVASLIAVMAARAAHATRDYAKRDQYLERASSLSPEAELARRVTEAELLLEQRDYPAALEAVERIKVLSPKLTSGLKLELRVRQRLGEPQQVLQLVDQLSRADALEPAYATAVRQQAALEFVQHSNLQPKKLKDWWHALATEDRQSAKLTACVARKLTELQADDLANDLLARALDEQWDPELVELYGSFNTEHGGKVLPQIQRAEAWLKTRPRDAVLLLTLGRLCRTEQLWGKAQSYIEASLAIQPTPVAYYELAELYERADRLEEAAELRHKGLDMAIKQG